MATLNRVERVLHLLRLLMRRGRSLEALTRELGVTERTLFRDLATLRAGGFAVTLRDRTYMLSLAPLPSQALPKRARGARRAGKRTPRIRRSA